MVVEADGQCFSGGCRDLLDRDDDGGQILVGVAFCSSSMLIV